MKSAGYFERFNKDYEFCVNKEFDQIYATFSQYSWANGKQFKDFCKAAGIPCEKLHPANYFRDGMCDGAFRTREYTYDAMILKDYLMEKLSTYSGHVKILYSVRIIRIEKLQDRYTVYARDGTSYQSEFVLNATYACTNQILDMAGFEKFRIKYELCEIILCDVKKKLKNTGFTVMDGPFFSIMPFGKTGFYDELPVFSCQHKSRGYCSATRLGNCNDCPERPVTAFPYMENLAKKYMLDDYKFTYRNSLFSMKPILMSSEIDDKRSAIF